MRIVTMADARERLEEFAAEVINQGERVLVARDGGEHLTIISTRELDTIEATLELLADPEAQRRIAEAEAAIAAGDVHSVDDVKADLERRRSEARAEPPPNQDDDESVTERINRCVEETGRDSSTDDAIVAGRRYLNRADDEW